MLLALDVGNTNTTLGLYKLDGEKPELAANWRVTTHRAQTVDEYGVFFDVVHSPRRICELRLRRCPPIRRGHHPG